MKHLKYLLLLLFIPISIQAQSQPVALPEETFHRSSAQNGVKVSTDVLLIAMPVVTLAGVLIEQDWKGLVQGAYTAAATLGATMILKYSVKEWRPDHSNRHSFPSGHTSATFATAAFVQRRYGWKLGAPAYALATYVGWGRIYAKKHHWWDVVAGAAIGAGSAYIFTRPWARDHELQISPIADPVTSTVGVTASFLL